jgi:hypothetical protein
MGAKHKLYCKCFYIILEDDPVILTLVASYLSRTFLACTMAKVGSPGDWERKRLRMWLILQTLGSVHSGFEYHLVREWTFDMDLQSVPP